jgi:hypothetical protein
VLYSRPLDPQAVSDYPRRCRVHHLVLSVVLERHPPALIALGPPTDTAEAEEAVDALRGTLRAIATVMRVPVIEHRSQEALIDTLDLRGRSFGRAIHRAMGRPLGSRDRRIVHAAAAAMAAHALGAAL